MLHHSSATKPLLAASPGMHKIQNNPVCLQVPEWYGFMIFFFTAWASHHSKGWSEIFHLNLLCNRDSVKGPSLCWVQNCGMHFPYTFGEVKLSPHSKWHCRHLFRNECSLSPWVSFLPTRGTLSHLNMDLTKSITVIIIISIITIIIIITIYYYFYVDIRLPNDR